jgi:nucleotide-binding universal stress UspA family protein
MAHIHKVLCALELDADKLPELDGATETVLRAAHREAALHDAELAVVHALPADPGAPMTPEATEQVVLQRSDIASAIIDALLAVVERVTGRDPSEVEVHVEDGPADQAIIDAADELGADLVVVGSTGARGLRRLLLGSVATRVVNHGHTSVLVARPAPETGWVLLAVDFTDSSQAAAELAVAEAQRRGARLIVMHSVEVLNPELVLAEPGVIPSPALVAPPLFELVEVARKRLTDFVNRLGVDAEIEVVEGPAADGIVRVARDRGVELVVVGSSGRSGLDRLLLGSVAAAVVRDASSPVLVARTRPASRPTQTLADADTAPYPSVHPAESDAP